MFKDYDKYLSTSLKVYLFVLVIIFIMKMVGLDYFGLDVENAIIIKINDFCQKYHLVDLWYCFTLYFYTYFVVSISTKNKNVYKLVLYFMPIIIFVKMLSVHYDVLGFILDIVVVTIITLIAKGNVKRTFLVILLNCTYQAISLIIRNKSIIIQEDDFIQSLIFNFDYILMCLITYSVYFKKQEGGIKCWEIGEVYSSSLKKLNLKKSLKKLQKNLHSFKKKFKELNKVEKISTIIYFILSLIWNTLSVFLILVVAFLNDTLIECIFIVTSFWLSKGKFGKPFHLKSMTHCFIVSNLTYYVLNRITTPLGISIIIPILLGVGLSYVTSKLVKKTYKPLYRGMPEDLFEETILKVTDKDSDKYAICYDFYINKKSTISLAMKYNYSEAGIRKIKDRINNKIKEL